MHVMQYNLDTQSLTCARHHSMHVIQYVLKSLRFMCMFGMFVPELGHFKAMMITNLLRLQVPLRVVLHGACCALLSDLDWPYRHLD